MKTRIISSFLMLLVFIPILLLGGTYYVVFGSILGIMSLYEMHRLDSDTPIIIKIFNYVICLVLILYNILIHDTKYLFLIFSLIFLLFALSIVINKDIKKYNYKNLVFLLATVLIIGLLYNGFIEVRITSLNATIYCFLIAIATDTFAYLGGRILGKSKLSTSISPNKTVEGSIIGSVFGTIIGSVFYYNIIGNTNLWLIILISLILTILAQIGDLFFSSIKRSYNIKDFSNLIPGHGGILDRLDSVLFVILGFLIYNLFI